MKFILSISGGGIRGLIPAIILAELERRTGSSIASCSDLIAGTSTGGIIACLLGITDSNCQSKYSAAAIVRMYKQFGKTVFNRSLWRKLITLDGLIGTKYPSRPLEKLLREFFGSARLSDADPNLLIPAYQITQIPYPSFFKTRRPDNNPYLWECARATSAANSYFKPYPLDPTHTFLDGGVFANNPSMCAYAEAKNTYGENEQLVILSIGTGEDLIGYSYREIQNWGMAQWAIPFFKQTSISADATIDYMLRAFVVNGDSYYRLQASLEKDCLTMDDASDEHLEKLTLAAKTVIRENDRMIDDIAALMLQGKIDKQMAAHSF